MTLFPAPSLDELRANAAQCTACDLHKHANQTVFGEGPPDAALMLIGEVPGDKEDLAGHPFVGPAGKVLDDALKDAEIDRTAVYLTNAVKHFKFEQRGKVRIHKKPNAAEIAACRQWWEAEVSAVQPDVLGVLGAVAGQAIFGPQFRVTKERGKWLDTAMGIPAVATIHPSAVLRAQERRDEEYAALVRDLKLMAAGPATGGSGRSGGAA
ncbi:MAG: UdgX family uracil-DNA binding protein [Acidimicrobiia bacterium]